MKNLEAKTFEDGFWSDSTKNKIVLSEIKWLKSKITNFSSIKSNIEESLEIVELLELEKDEELEKDLFKNIKLISDNIEKFELQLLLSGKHDTSNAIVTIHPGAGGTESQDWAEMIYRMYLRWAGKNSFKTTELDFQEGEEAGIKSVSFEVTGEMAYGYLKSEMGVHRLVRISPFDSGGRRHTSFASVEVLPEIEEDEEIEINQEDLRIDTYRASGAGGQHINKTSSAIRITHIPTNIVVACQTQRSQFQNKDNAIKMLKAKLIQKKEKEQQEAIDKLKGIQSEIGWGSQIRSYVFCPYTLVKDHRTNYEVRKCTKCYGWRNRWLYGSIFEK